MCGISGFIQPVFDENSARTIIQSMTNSIKSRGPDDEGYWFNSTNGLVLGHRRLAIQDLSAAGHQPMQSETKRFTIVFNGEIYNHFELRELLALEKKINWKGRSDTETLLAGFEYWGVEETIKKSIGMFAFAVFDAQQNTLTLGRDRLGEKPLYYGWQGESFIFASTLSPFHAHPDFLKQIDRQALTLYFRYAYVPGEFCIYKGLHKLAAGCLLTFSFSDKKIQFKKYWSFVDVLTHAKANPFLGSELQALDQLQEILSRAVKKQLLSDVPLGVFLSGGIDSSIVAALMQAQVSQPINTFSIGFNQQAFNEAEQAKEVAQHLGTHHNEYYVSAEDALNVIPELPFIYDEPFADSSQIPSYLVSKMSKQKVTVVLTGDGGDEVFAGYTRYLATAQLWSKLNKVPVFIRKLLARLLISVPETQWQKLLSYFNFTKSWLPFAYKLHKAAAVLAAKNIDDLYLQLVSQWQEPEKLIRVDADQEVFQTTENTMSNLTVSDVEFMMASDTLGYLCDDILVKVDRAAMAVSLETRVPLLNHELLAFAWSLPMELKIKQGESKYVLKQLLYRFVPKHLVDKPKTGFAVPLDDWLRGPLKEWAEKLLDETRIKQEGILNSEPIQKKWQEHLSGKRNWAAQLWCVLMFQAWLETQGSKR